MIEVRRHFIKQHKPAETKEQQVQRFIETCPLGYALKNRLLPNLGKLKKMKDE